MVNIVTSNLVLLETNIEFALTKPFGEIAKREKDFHCGRSWVICRTWVLLLSKLIVSFEKEPEIDFAVTAD